MRVGAALPLTGPLPEAGRDVRAALAAVFDEVKRQGGVYGRAIELVVEESRGEAGATRGRARLPRRSFLRRGRRGAGLPRAPGLRVRVRQRGGDRGPGAPDGSQRVRRFRRGDANRRRQDPERSAAERRLRSGSRFRRSDEGRRESSDARVARRRARAVGAVGSFVVRVDPATRQ
ncbi:MAG: hypothetical protein E6J64_05165 [Deltaproteobacteria bacterium]|nr:MAG: hypothetical protein E6J64_05165 [Deltaproteobacteria bacterium]